MIRLESVEKRYDSQPVLRGVSLSVEPGELLSLVGRSGSGKSTLLHIMGGLDRRYTGRASVLGHDLHTLGDAALARFRNREVGFIFQAFNLIGDLTVYENVELPLTYRGMPSSERKRRVENFAAGQRAFAHRARMNGLATLGKWSRDLEKAA